MRGDIHSSFPETFLEHLVEDFREDPEDIAKFYKRVFKLIGKVQGISKETVFLRAMERFEARCKEAGKKVWGLAFPPKWFVGRASELLHLKKQCQPPESGDKTQTFLISGSGGMGKSQLARKFLLDQGERFSLGWWIDAETEDTLIQSLQRLSLALQMFPTRDLTPQEAASKVVATLSSGQLAGWVLVYDNVEVSRVPKIATDFIPASGGLCLFTSRTSLPDLVAEERTIRLDELTIEESQDLLCQICSAERSEVTEALASRLGCLPLALHQAGTFILRAKISPESFLKMLEKEEEKLMDLELEGPRAGERGVHSISATLLLSIERIQEQHPDCLPLLQKLGFLAPDGISYLILADPSEEQLSIEQTLFLGAFDDYSIVTIHQAKESKGQEGGEDTLAIHRLMQTVVRRHCQPVPPRDCLLLLARKLASLLEKAGESTKETERRGRLLPHAEAVLHYIQDVCPSQDQVEAALMRNCALTVDDLGEIERERLLLEKHLALQETFFGKESPEMASSLTDLGEAHRLLGDAKKAREVLQRALSLQEAVSGKDSLPYSLTLHKLGNALRTLGEIAEAQKLWKEALDIKERHLGESDVEVAKSLVNLATSYGDLGQRKEERSLLTRALGILEERLGSAHVHVALALMNLANCEISLGNPSVAVGLLERALDIQEKYYGPNHFQVAMTLGNLGTALGDLGDFQRKHGLLQRALNIEEAHYGKGNPQTLPSLVELGESLCSLGRLEEAREVLERALSLQEKHFGKGFLETLFTLIALGRTYLGLKDQERALQYLNQALQVAEKSYPEESPERATAQLYLGIAQKNRRKLVHSLDALRQMNYSQGHPHVSRGREALQEMSSPCCLLL